MIRLVAIIAGLLLLAGCATTTYYHHDTGGDYYYGDTSGYYNGSSYYGSGYYGASTTNVWINTSLVGGPVWYSGWAGWGYPWHARYGFGWSPSFWLGFGGYGMWGYPGYYNPWIGPSWPYWSAWRYERHVPRRNWQSIRRTQALQASLQRSRRHPARVAAYRPRQGVAQRAARRPVQVRRRGSTAASRNRVPRRTGIPANWSSASTAPRGTPTRHAVNRPNRAPARPGTDNARIQVKRSQTTPLARPNARPTRKPVRRTRAPVTVRQHSSPSRSTPSRSRNTSKPVTRSRPVRVQRSRPVRVQRSRPVTRPTRHARPAPVRSSAPRGRPRAKRD